MADDTDFDVVVIGGGPGGYAAALYGSLAGLRIAVIEQDKVSGICLHRGCFPAKEFLETAAVARTVAGAKNFGIQVGPATLG
jgi:dihydrolipoamide dehydrogenase